MPITAAFAARTARLAGTAANVILIRPLEYSPVIASTPSAAKINWAIMNPMNESASGSTAVCRSGCATSLASTLQTTMPMASAMTAAQAA